MAQIRSNLASLESLESELVPALTSLYMEPSTVACLHANLLVEHWLQEVRNLKNSVCFIIDPAAFGQVYMLLSTVILLCLSVGSKKMY